jgi:hypothetical protein
MRRAILLMSIVALTSGALAGQRAAGPNVVLSLEVLTRGLVYSRGTFDPDVRGYGEYPVFFEPSERGVKALVYRGCSRPSGPYVLPAAPS